MDQRTRLAELVEQSRGLAGEVSERLKQVQAVNDDSAAPTRSGRTAR